MIGRLLSFLGWHQRLEFELQTSNWTALRQAAANWRPTWHEIQIAKAQAEVAGKVWPVRRAQ